ncbi:MAG: aldehyde dehydrogenase family protein [Vulcanimicrobiaceae bacterium]
MIADQPRSNELDFRAVFAEQRRRYRAQPNPPIADRRAKLERLERALRGHREALKAALYRDFRKPAAEAESTELIVTLAEIKYVRAKLASWAKPQKVATPALVFGARGELRYEPKGVVLVLAPWNYPVFLTIVPLIAAIAAGNRVILRPSEKAPATRDVLASIVAEAFVPHDVACIAGDVDTATELLRLPFDHIFFTGSTRVGKIVMRAAAEHLASVTLELGGKSPCIVDRTADVGRAADRIAWGKFVNAGQTCIAPDYVLVHESVERPLLDALRRSVARMYGESDDARKATPDYCRMIDDGHFARIDALLAATVACGARVEVGGQTDAAQRYIAPTVLAGVGPGAPIMDEEIFGPVLPVLTYATLDDALVRINARPKPLALYAFSRDERAVEKILGGTSAGGTLVNDTVLHCANHNLPFGGVGESGIGSYHGHFGFKAFSHERAVMRQTKASLAPMLEPPYTVKTRATLAMMERLP